MRNTSHSIIKKVLEDKRRKRIALAIFVPLCCAAVILSVVLTILTAHAGPGDQWDMYNYVTGVTIKDVGGSVVTNGQFAHGSPYTFEIWFQEFAGTNGQFAYNGQGKLIYQLPPELVVVTPVSNGQIRVANGSTVGSYTLDSNGHVEIVFGEFDSQGVPTPGICFFDNYTDTSFGLSVYATFKSSVQPGQIRFGANATLTVVNITQPGGQAKLDVAKTAGTYNANDETIAFTITVTANGGPVSDITLEDILAVTGGFVSGTGAPANYRLRATDQNLFRLGSMSGSLRYQFGQGSSWVNMASAPWTGSGANSALLFDFSKDGPLAAGDKITITYTLQLADLLDYFGAQGSAPASRWIQRLKYDLNLQNAANASGMNSANNPVSGSKTTASNLRKNDITKYNQINGTLGAQYISWTASVGGASANLLLNGSTVTDTWSAGQTNPVITQVSVHRINPSTNARNVYTLSPAEVAQYLTYTPISNPTGFTFNIPPGGFTGGSGGIGYTGVTRIEFKYNISVSTAGTYTNQISINYKDNVSSDQSTARVSPAAPTDISMKKDSEWVYDADGEPIAIKYTVTAVIPAGLQNKRLYLSDTLKITNSDTDTIGGISMVRFIPAMTVTIDPTPTQSYAPSYTPESGRCYVSVDYNVLNWRMYFSNSNNASTANNYWPFSDQRTVTVTYEVPLSARLVDSTDTIKDRLLQRGWRLDNYADIFFQDGLISGNYAPYHVQDYFPIHKEGKKNAGDPSVFDYTVSLNWRTNAANTSTRTYQHSLFKQGAALFADTFDPRLEYVPGSLYVREFQGSSTTNIRYYGPYDTSGNETVSVSGNSITADLSIFREYQSFNGNPATSPLRTSVQTPLWYTQTNRCDVHYQLRVRPEYRDEYTEGTEGITLPNTAKVYATSDKFAGGNWTGKANVQYRKKAIEKEINTDGSNIAKVEIVVNPLGRRLVPGSIGQDWYKAVDTMTGPLMIYQHSIAFYTQTKDQDGNWSGTWKTTPETINPVFGDGNLWSIRMTGPQKNEFILPDKTPVKIEYMARITSEPGVEASFDNAFCVYGYVDVAGWDKYIVNGSQLVADGTAIPLKIVKEDKSDQRRLPGAEFELYMALTNNGYYTTGSPTKHITVGDGSDARDFYYVATVATNQHGTVSFDSTWITPSHKAMYMLVETAAPVGYALPPPPENRDFVYIHNISASDKSMWEQAIGRTLQAAADAVYMTNERISGLFVPAAVKNATGSNMTAGQFKFSLYESDSSGTQGSLIEQLSNPQGGSSSPITFATIKLREPGDHYFLMKEMPVTDRGWSGDKAQYQIRVHVVEGVEAVAAEVRADSPPGSGSFSGQWLLYDATQAAVPVFTNIYATPTIPVSISGKKTIEGTASTNASFTFTLTQVADDTGTPINGDKITRQVSRSGQGPFTFPAMNLEEGTYYFEIRETKGSANGWTYDTKAEIIKVTAEFDSSDQLKASVYWMPKEVKTGTSLFTNLTVPANIYNTIPATWQTRNQSAVGSPVYGYTAGRASGGNESFLAYYTNPGYTAFGNWTNLTVITNKDNTPAVLSYALVEQTANLNDAQFKTFFGIPQSQAMSAAERRQLAQHLIWAYEGNPQTPPFGSFAAAHFVQAKAMMDEMMAQYGEGQNTALTLIYSRTTPTTGTLTFEHSGFVPCGAGSEEYSAVLSWPNTTGLTVKKNGTAISSGTAVTKTDELTVEYAGTQSVKFTLADNARYLKEDTIRGVLLTTTTVNHPKLIYGTAQFITLSSEVTVTSAPPQILAETDISFHNTYSAVENDGNILPSVGGPGTVVFTAASATLASLMSLFFIGTLLYRRCKYRRWFHMRK